MPALRRSWRFHAALLLTQGSQLPFQASALRCILPWHLRTISLAMSWLVFRLPARCPIARTCSNLQAIGGLDRWFFDHATSLVPYLVMSAVARLGSNWAVNLGRLRAMSLPTAAPQRQRLAPVMQQQVKAPPQLRSAKQAAGKRQRRVKGFEMSISNSGGAQPAGAY